MSNNNKDLTRFELVPLPISNYDLVVNKRTAKLLYLSKEEPAYVPSGFGVFGVSIKINLLNGQIELEDSLSKEPSTIYLKLLISKPSDINVIPRPNYYPSYVQLTPEQRWVYLNWLQDVSKSIDIGYVFLYYYGLERQLLIGEFDLAIDEIIHLRKYHSNRSFIFYSSRALLYSCIIRKRLDKLSEAYQLIECNSLENTRLLVAHRSGLDLTAKSLIEISKNIRDINRRYINKNFDIFENVLNECLVAKYGDKFFPFHSKYKIEDLPKYRDIVFANFSFPSEIRSPDLPNFFQYQPFVNEFRSLFEETHEKVKKLIRDKRKCK